MLLFTIECVEFLPNLSEVDADGQSLSDKFPEVMVACLTSSKSETRSAAVDLLNRCLKSNVISFKSVTKGTARLKPAHQMSVGGIIAKLEKGAESHEGGDNEEHKPCDNSQETKRAPPSLSSNNGSNKTIIPRKATAPEHVKTDFPKATMSYSQNNTGRAPVRPPKKDHVLSTMRPESKPVAVEDSSAQIMSDTSIPPLEDALTTVSALNIPRWGDSEDDGGILAGLQCKFSRPGRTRTMKRYISYVLDIWTASKWQFRQSAIMAFVTVSKSDGIQASVISATSSILVVVKENTRGFKESNFNVTKAIMELFLALGDIHASASQRFPEWGADEAVMLALDKIGDKKLSAVSKALLTLMCVVSPPSSVLQLAARQVEKVKSPLTHEELLNWCKYFLTEFGAASIRSAMKGLVPWLLQVSLLFMS